MRTPSGSTVSLVLSAFTIACSDSTTSLTQHASYAQLQDGEINQSDSHFMTNVSLSQSITIDSSESFPHPETGEPTTSYTYTQPTIGLYVEGGYDNAGRTRINLRVDSDPGNDEPAEHRVGYMKQIDDAPYHYVATGAPLENEYNMDAPMSDLGTLVDVTYESVVGYQPPSGGGGGGGGGGELMSVVGGIPTRTTLTRLSNRRLRVVREGEFREGGLTLFSLADKKTTTKEERLYEHDGNEYVLRERTLESEESFAGGSTKLKQRMVLAKTKYLLNRGKDKERKARRAEREKLAVGHSPSETPLAFDENTGIIREEEESSSGGGGGVRVAAADVSRRRRC